jgi:ribosomal protein L11 methyltransferase
MKWTKVRLKTTVDAEDILISSLYEIGIEGVEIEDKVPLTPLEKEQLFVDILPEMEVDEGEATLNFYLDENADTESILINVKEVIREVAEFIDIGEGSIEISETEDIDWINNWKQYFKSYHIDDIHIIPSWEEINEDSEDKLVIRIDPGIAFGTGMHETTQLCIRQLRKHVKPDDVILDVGCGSGILGMLALKFGAKFSYGIDLDPFAIEATHKNMEENGIREDQYNLLIGNLIDEPKIQEKIGFEQYDIAVANILAEVLVLLTPVVAKHLKKGGIYITSGILNEKTSIVKEAMDRAGLFVVEVKEQGEWSSVTARKSL